MILSINVFSQETDALKNQENINTNNIYEKADSQALFPGGINAFRRNFTQVFDVSRIKGKGKVQSEAMFVIDQQGLITDVIARGENKSMNKEMERSIKALSKTKWKPAMIGDIPVKYRYRFPITVNLD